MASGRDEYNRSVSRHMLGLLEITVPTIIDGEICVYDKERLLWLPMSGEHMQKVCYNQLSGGDSGDRRLQDDIVDLTIRAIRAKTLPRVRSNYEKVLLNRTHYWDITEQRVIRLVTGPDIHHSGNYWKLSLACGGDEVSAAKTDDWESFIRYCVNGNAPTFQEFLGYTCLASTPYKKMLIAYGPRDSGKTTIIQAILAALHGDLHVTNQSFDEISGSKNLEILQQSYVNLSDEIPKGYKLSGNLLKQLINVDKKVTVNPKYHRRYDMTLITKFMITTNNIPVIEGLDDAVVSRILAIPFTNKENRRDTNLKHWIQAQAPAITRWALQGLSRLVANDGVFTPPSTDIRELLEQEDDDLRTFKRIYQPGDSNIEFGSVSEICSSLGIDKKGVRRCLEYGGYLFDHRYVYNIAYKEHHE